MIIYVHYQDFINKTSNLLFAETPAYCKMKEPNAYIIHVESNISID